MTKLTSLSLALIVATTSNAFAHHPLGGAAPETMLHGFLSGVGHPLIGFDHLAFVIGVGLIAAFHKNRAMMPAGFVVGTMIGTLLTVSMVALPLAEIVITASVVGAGIVAMRGKLTNVMPATIIAAAAGLFHGWAYGAAVIGAEATPIIAYMVGFGAIQMVIALGTGMLAHNIWKTTASEALQPRLAGAMVAGVGLAYLVENLEGMIFPGM